MKVALQATLSCLVQALPIYLFLVCVYRILLDLKKLACIWTSGCGSEITRKNHGCSTVIHLQNFTCANRMKHSVKHTKFLMTTFSRIENPETPSTNHNIIVRTFAAGMSESQHKSVNIGGRVAFFKNHKSSRGLHLQIQHIYCGHGLRVEIGMCAHSCG